MKRWPLLLITLAALAASWVWQQRRPSLAPQPQPPAATDAGRPTARPQIHANSKPGGASTQRTDSERADSERADSKRTRPSASGETAPSLATGPLAALRAKPLRYTRHARCRMGCRFIDEQEVEEILQRGRLDPNRTRDNGQCTSYALEGDTHDDQHVRIVFANCARETRVVTVIDLDTNHPCKCR